MNKLRQVREVLDEINSALVAYDPILKESARDLMLRTAFGPDLSVVATTTDAVSVDAAAAPAEPASAEAGDPAAGAPDAAPVRRRRRRKATSVADLLEMWRPSKASERALLGAYFISRYTDRKHVTSQAVNSALKEQGLEVANITRAIETNLNSSPPLMSQVEKRGTTRQARKLYRITAAGILAVEERLYEKQD
jgi:hypothetical protein